MALRATGGAFGLVVAMADELGPFRGGGDPLSVGGLELRRHRVGEAELLTAVAGVGKVAAARAAALLVAAGADRALLVAGVCGALRRGLVVGDLVHCTRTVQADLAVREGRELAADDRIAAAWRGLVEGPAGWFVTADRPVLSPWRRLRLARAFLGPCVADMETAAAARVAALSGVPWAALRAVTDGAGFGAGRDFQANFAAQAGRAAASVPALLARLSAAT